MVIQLLYFKARLYTLERSHALAVDVVLLKMQLVNVPILAPKGERFEE